jgi:hypothetical protein
MKGSAMGAETVAEKIRIIPIRHAFCPQNRISNKKLWLAFVLRERRDRRKQKHEQR